MGFIEKKESIVLVTYCVILIVYIAYSVLTGVSSSCRNAQIDVAFFIIGIPIIYWNLRKRVKSDPEHDYRLEYTYLFFISLFIIYLCIGKIYNNCFGG